MAFRDTWHRALVYFGLAEDPEYQEPDLYEPDTGTQGEHYEAPASRSANGQPAARAATRPRRDRRHLRRRRAAWAAGATRTLRPVGGNGGADVRVHLVTPYSFNDAQEVADKFKQAVPVILNLQTTDAELAKRLIDFTSGLTYALEGGMQKIAEKTFLLTPRNVEVSAEEKARLIEKGFFNQS